MKKEDVDKMTVQEACDYSVRKIVAQGKRCKQIDARHGGDACVYGDGEGNHCAIGWLLDEDDKELMTTLGILGSIINSMPHKFPDLIINNSGVFAALQLFHDTENVMYRVEYMKRLSEIYGVDTSGDHWKEWLMIGDPVQVKNVDLYIKTILHNEEVDPN